MLSVALTIAGSDPSGGAGIQADLKTFHQFGVYGEAVITLLTVQNSLRVSRVETLPPSLVLEQLQAVLEDIPPHAAKTGALGSAGTVRTVARAAADFQFPLVVDPVMVSKHGSPLLTGEAVRAVAEELLPRAALITPNIPEAETLTGLSIRGVEDMRRAADRLLTLGVKVAVVKGGHLDGDTVHDLVATESGGYMLSSPRIETRHTHGTGCTLASAIATGLAQGMSLRPAVTRARRYLTEALASAPGYGQGHGPLDHAHTVRLEEWGAG